MSIKMVPHRIPFYIMRQGNGFLLGTPRFPFWPVWKIGEQTLEDRVVHVVQSYIPGTLNTLVRSLPSRLRIFPPVKVQELPYGRRWKELEWRTFEFVLNITVTVVEEQVTWKVWLNRHELECPYETILTVTGEFAAQSLLETLPTLNL